MSAAGHTASGPDFGIKAEVQHLRSVLDRLVPPDNRSDLRSRGADSHPILQKLDYLDRVEADGGVSYEDELEAMRSLCGVILDKETWFHPWDDRPQISANAWARFQARIREPNQYDDVMAELHTWGFIKRLGLPVSFIEDEGKADLLVTDTDEFAVEVKRIHLGTPIDRVKAVVTKANKQLKAVAPEKAGLVYIFIDRDPLRASLDNEMPNDIVPFKDEIQRLLNSGFFRCIGGVHVVWDEFRIDDDWVGTTHTLTFIRKSQFVVHPNPRGEVSTLIPKLGLSSSIIKTIAFPNEQIDLPAITVSDLQFSAEFRKYDENIHGVRVNHVIDVIRNPHSRLDLDLDGIRFSILAKRGTVARLQMILIVLVSEDIHSSMHPVVLRGLCIWDLEEAPLVTRPGDLFLWFLQRFGAEIIVGDLRGLFFHDVRIRAEGDINFLSIPELSPGEHDREWQVTALAQFGDADRPEERIVHVSLAYAVEGVRYKEAHRLAKKNVRQKSSI